MHKTHFKLKKRSELKAADKPIILRGWTEFFVVFFIITFVIQLIMLIILNWNF
ncbi:MAG: hypothetical protein WCJ57_01990 [Candidatus Falkowbacteria bacterium]